MKQNNSVLLEEIKLANKALKEHKVICFPTETVMGLAVFYDDFKAYNLLNTIKQRPEDKPYTMMVKSVEEIYKYAYVDERAEKIIKKYMPGSLTVLLPARENVPGWVTHNSGVIGIRIPTNEIGLSLLQNIEKPVLVPSCNKSGQKPAKTLKEAKEIFSDEVEFYVSGDAGSGVASTIVDLSKNEISLIREGQIPFEDILNLLKC